MALSLAIGVIAFLAVAWFVLSATYRIVFHPLSSIPGPWIHKISPIPAALVLLSGKQHFYYYKLHQKYGITLIILGRVPGSLINQSGPVCQVSPDEVIFQHADAWEEVYGNRKGKPMEKSPIFIGVVSPMNGCVGLGVAKGAEHTRRRRALAPGVSKHALYGQEQIVQAHVKKLVARLRSAASKRETVNMADWYTYVTFDVIGDLCFAEPFGCLDQGAATTWSTSIVKVLVSATWDQAVRRVVGVDTWLRSLMMKILVPASAAQWRRIHLEKTREKTLQRLSKNDTDHPDILHAILRQKDTQRALTPTELILDMALFTSAGSETTSILLTAWTYLVCTHNDVYARLKIEISDAVEDSSSITVDVVMGLKYLGATIEEALRLFPPALVTQGRVVPPGGATIQGYDIPEGCTVGVSQWCAARSPINFSFPGQFRPERWLAEPSQLDSPYSNDRFYASRPFSYGPKSCLGQNLSYLEARLIMCHLLVNFDFELDAGSSDSNSAWVTESSKGSIKQYQAMAKPDLWIRFREARK